MKTMEGFESNNKLIIVMGIIILAVIGSLVIFLNSNSKSAENNIITVKNQATRANVANNIGGTNTQNTQSDSQNKKADDFSFTAQERPAFQFPSVAYASDLKNKTTVYNSRGEIVNTSVDVNQSGKGSVVSIGASKEFMPGKYTMVINDNGKKISQDFTWGVLAINTNKSIYTPGQTALLALAVLDEKGKMVCDAKVTLKITDPTGNTTISSTENGLIKVNEECFVKDLTTKPDYETAYKVQAPGIYQMNLSAVTKNGTFQIQDYFLVKDSVDFDVERTTGTRIFPFKTYPVLIQITANKDFKGDIKEIAPESFTITQLEGVKAYDNVEETNAAKYITWNLSLKKGESINLGYNFKSPVISPEFYLLGPLSFISGNTVVFEEARAWQLAIDDVTYSSTVLGTTGLIDYWRLGDAGPTNAADSGPGNHTGTYTVSTGSITFGVAGALASDTDTAVTLTNSAGTEHQFINVTGVQDFGAGVGTTLTFEAWVKKNTAGTDQGIIGRPSGTATAQWYMYRCGQFSCPPNAGKIVFGNGAQDVEATTNFLADTTTWHYVVGTRDSGGVMRVYVDGQDAQGVTLGGSTPTSNTGALTLGLDLAGDYWPGSLDEVAIYTVALTPAQIRQHYNLGTGNNSEFKFQGLRMEGLRFN